MSDTAYLESQLSLIKSDTCLDTYLLLIQTGTELSKFNQVLVFHGLDLFEPGDTLEHHSRNVQKFM